MKIYYVLKAILIAILLMAAVIIIKDPVYIDDLEWYNYAVVSLFASVYVSIERDYGQSKNK